MSESLARSAMVKRAGGVMPLRETAILVALVNHPALIDENFEHVETLDLSNADLRRLHAGIIDAAAHGQTGGREQCSRPSRPPASTRSGSAPKRWCGARGSGRR